MINYSLKYPVRVNEEVSDKACYIGALLLKIFYLLPGQDQKVMEMWLVCPSRCSSSTVRWRQICPCTKYQGPRGNSISWKNHWIWFSKILKRLNSGNIYGWLISELLNQLIEEHMLTEKQNDSLPARFERFVVDLRFEIDGKSSNS